MKLLPSSSTRLPSCACSETCLPNLVDLGSVVEALEDCHDMMALSSRSTKGAIHGSLRKEAITPRQSIKVLGVAVAQAHKRPTRNRVGFAADLRHLFSNGRNLVPAEANQERVRAMLRARLDVVEEQSYLLLGTCM